MSQQQTIIVPTILSQSTPILVTFTEPDPNDQRLIAFSRNPDGYYRVIALACPETDCHCLGRTLWDKGYNPLQTDRVGNYQHWLPELQDAWEYYQQQISLLRYMVHMDYALRDLQGECYFPLEEERLALLLMEPMHFFLRLQEKLNADGQWMDRDLYRQTLDQVIEDERRQRAQVRL